MKVSGPLGRHALIWSLLHALQRNIQLMSGNTKVLTKNATIQFYMFTDSKQC
jgi:hypothetical protein